MAHQTELTAADGHRLTAYAAGPEDAAKALVVAQEIFGVNRHMRHVADIFAGQGYRVLCPALFDRAERGVELGYGPDDVARGRDLRARVPEAGTLADIEAAARALATDGRRVGIVGYCWGGTVAWWGATRSRLFGAAIGWYGGGIAATCADLPRCPVQLHFGENDASIPLTDVEAIRKAQPDIEVYVYPGVGHGFGCEERATYDEPATKLAETRTLAFLAAHL